MFCTRLCMIKWSALPAYFYKAHMETKPYTNMSPNKTSNLGGLKFSKFLGSSYVGSLISPNAKFYYRVSELTWQVF